jgi:hypothetical protein
MLVHQKVPERTEVLTEENQHLFTSETLAKYVLRIVIVLVAGWVARMAGWGSFPDSNNNTSSPNTLINHRT